MYKTLFNNTDISNIIKIGNKITIIIISTIYTNTFKYNKIK